MATLRFRHCLGRRLNRLQIVFATLSPYGPQVRTILKIERDNFDPVTRKQRQLYCLAISAKRYALFLLDEEGAPVLLQKGVNNGEDRWSEHGLGHLRNPCDLEGEDHDWIRQAWVGIVRRALGLPTQPLSFEGLPAVGRVTISSPAVMRSLSPGMRAVALTNAACVPTRHPNPRCNQ